MLGVRMGTTSTLTKFVTVTGNASELIDGSNTRLMWSLESAILYCDGAGWTKVAGRVVPMLARLGLSSDQSVANTTIAKILLNRTDADNTGAMCDPTTSNIITLRRSSNYLVSGKVAWNGAQANSQTVRTITTIFLTSTGGAQVASAEADYSGLTNASFNAPVAFDLYAGSPGDVLLLAGYQASGASANALGAADSASCSLLVVEQPNW
jgi:hypothetical protein